MEQAFGCTAKIHGQHECHRLTISDGTVQLKYALCLVDFVINWYSLAPPGVNAQVHIQRPPTYTQRYDVMGALLGDRLLPVDILTPYKKGQLHIRGYTKELLPTPIIPTTAKRKIIPGGKKKHLPHKTQHTAGNNNNPTTATNNNDDNYNHMDTMIAMYVV